MIGDVQVRNRGSIGGSLAHADPASDIAAPAPALGFELVARSAGRGERTIAIDDLFAGPFATTLEPDEIIVEVRVPPPAPSTASAYVALPQPASGYPIAGVADIHADREYRAVMARVMAGRAHQAALARQHRLDASP